MTNKPSNQSKVRRWIRAPLRLLGKAKNSYVEFMHNFAEFAGPGDDMGLPPSYFSSVPIRTFPSTDANDHLQDPIRAHSKSNTENRVGSKNEIGSKSERVKKVELEILQLRQQRQSQAMAMKAQRRKCCEVIGTIDEDKPCEFSDDLKVRTDFLQQPRTRSSAFT